MGIGAGNEWVGRRASRPERTGQCTTSVLWVGKLERRQQGQLGRDKYKYKQEGGELGCAVLF